MKIKNAPLLEDLRKVGSKGSFVQNVSIVFVGNSTNFILQLIFAPVLSRIFPPEAYGNFAIYNVIITNIIFFGSLSLPSVYVLPDKKEEFFHLLKLTTFGVLVAIVVGLTGVYFFSTSNDLFPIHLIVALGFFLLVEHFLGIFQSLNIRKKGFKRNALVGNAGSLIGRLSSVSVGFFLIPTAQGLLIGDFAKKTFEFFFVVSWQTKREIFSQIFSLNKGWSKETLIKYKQTIFFNFPSQLMTKFSGDLPVIAISYFLGSEKVGHFAFSLALLSIPLNLIQRAIGPVMLQKASEMMNKSGEIDPRLFLKSYKGSLVIGFIPYILIGMLSPILFPIVFGEPWSFSGEIALLLCIRFFLVSTLFPFTSYWRIYKKEKRLFFLNLITIGFRILPLGLLLFKIEFTYFILIYSLVFSVAPFINLLDLFRMVLSKRRTRMKLMLMTLAFFLISSSVVIIFALQRSII